ncbi:hypothetical protein AAHS21_21070, partial [Mycobacterium sp. 050272]
TRRGLPRQLFLRHTCILVSKVRSLRDFQGVSIFLLRARSFVDRTQSVTLAVGAVVAVAVVIGRYASAPNPASPAVTLVCVAAALILGGLGLFGVLVVPKARISAPVNRAVEVSEYILLIFVAPWAIWLLNLLWVVRNAVHGS